MFTLIDYRTRKTLAHVERHAFSKWCTEHNYLPHHRVAANIWYVI